MINKEIANTPRVIIAGTSSNCGKTTITVGILQALVNRRLKVASFKCGPDYIDPMFHGEIIGTSSSNLDSFFMKDDIINYLVYKNSSGNDISVMEGVMGYYDGAGLNTVKSSTYDIAKITSTPVILIINCKGMATSVLALLKGFAEFKQDSNIKGVILNNITKTTYEALKLGIEEQHRGDIKVLGYIPKLSDDLIFSSRHLGLVTSSEILDIKDKLNKLSEVVEESVNLDLLIEIAVKSKKLVYKVPYIERFNENINIAVAKDKAFCFYYKDNLKLLEEMGANLVYFSPLADSKLPQNIDGIYLGGGYPELYLEQLSNNKSMLKSINTALNEKVPCIAECGGFMYLCDSIESHNMVAYIKGSCTNKGKLQRFGYVNLVANERNMLCEKGESIKAHEFHYYDAEDCGDSFKAIKSSGKEWNCVNADDSLYAGFPHMHFYSNLSFAENFYRKCIAYSSR